MSGQERDVVDRIFEIGKRRGFFWQSYEIYGGVAGFYDMGPYGILLKNNIIDKWRRFFIGRHQELIVEIETPIIAPSKVFEASGHVSSFTDPIVECLSCHRLFRADHLIEDKLGFSVEGYSNEELTRLIRENDIKCPVCGGVLGEVRSFNLLFQTQIGPYTGSIGYVRPETAQGMFVAFKRVYQAMRERLPLGIAQVGRVGRNEISPRQGMLRLREFTIMEFEFFFDPEDPGHEPYFDRMADKRIRILSAEDKRAGRKEPREYTVREAVEKGIVINPWLAYWMGVAQDFMESLGVPAENQFFEEKLPEERAHYSRQTFDQLVKTERWGWIEVSGHAYRGDYDLSGHMKHSGEDLRVYKRYPSPVIEEKKKIIIDKKLLGKTFRSEAKDIIGVLETMDKDKLIQLLDKNEPLVINGKTIPKDAVKIIVVKEKINGKRFIPHVVEPSFGVERLVYITMEYGFKEKEDRVILSLPRDLAPVKVAVFPLVNNKELVEKARRIYDLLVEKGFTVMYDASGSIGRRYARADEIGVPYAVTVDFQSLEDETVTVRDRDSWEQVRVGINDLPDHLWKLLRA